ncbi:MAG: formylglycine-generating enzyme family protein, partial [Treponema sp.]|nr:formylglycine-generating enzyme family protein [Treponema sp.]
FVYTTDYDTDAEMTNGGGVWMGSNYVTMPDASWYHPYISQDDDHPVVLVSWFDAVQYCNWLSSQDGLTPAYTIRGYGDSRTVSWNQSANGYRLPTEAEWEYACRAGTTTAFNTGSNFYNYSTGWSGENSGYGTHPVGQLPANKWGLYDMHGNVGEWCWDWADYYPNRSQTDPVGASSGSQRIIRGGSWPFSSMYARSAARSYIYPNYRYNYIGFRIVRNVK